MNQTASFALQQAIIACTARSWRLQSSSASMAVMVSGGGQGVNHILHLLLTVFTFGLWAPIWLLVAICGAPAPQQSLLITVDEYGNVGYQQGL